MNRSISFSSFYKYLKKNIKKPHRLTDLCEYCEYGKILEKDTNLNPEESNLLQAIKIHRQFANSQQDLYKFQTSNEDFLKENIEHKKKKIEQKQNKTTLISFAISDQSSKK